MQRDPAGGREPDGQHQRTKRRGTEWLIRIQESDRHAGRDSEQNPSSKNFYQTSSHTPKPQSAKSLRELITGNLPIEPAVGFHRNRRTWGSAGMHIRDAGVAFMPYAANLFHMELS